MLDVAIIGGGQSGLAMGYYLSQSNIRHLIFEKGSVAQSWKDRYESLRLITPKEYSQLPGLAFPEHVDGFPHKNDVVRYLEAYAGMIKSPVKEGCTVHRVTRGDSRNFRIETSEGDYECDQVVMATGYQQQPYIPAFSKDISQSIFQVHSHDYRQPADVPKGVTLVVGSGNTGISIAKELAADRKVYLAQGKIKRFPRKLFGRDIFWWAEKLGLFRLNTHSWLGKRISRKMIASGDATYGLYPETLARQFKVTLTERIVSVNGSTLITADGNQLTDVAAIVWATGFRPAYSKWIGFDIFDDKGIPVHDRGVTSVPGLYFLGLKWQYTISSFLLHGVGQDAAYLAEQIKRLHLPREKQKRYQDTAL